MSDMPQNAADHLTAKGVPPNFIAAVLAKGCPPGRGWLETYTVKGHKYARWSWRVQGSKAKHHVHLGPVGPAA